ncbi:MAG TPA: SDR family oxidoreductase [Egibacteraceae bacterium]|nr:SDR family oxidoreductase [Egibacteraceae bacterium]
MDLQLQGKVAVVTGGNAGIGLAVARGLAGEGAHVVLCGRDEARSAAEAERIRADFDVEALPVKCDVTEPGDLEAAAKAVEESFGGADILFNNAGEGTSETIMDAGDSRWQYYWDLHLMAAVRMSRALIPGMRARGGGAIVNNASICARQPLHHEPIYNVTKAALVMLTKCLAHEVIGDGIRVNCINPGLIQTAGWVDWAKAAEADGGPPWQSQLDAIAVRDTPIGRFASPEELAHFIVFLCSPRASYSVGSAYYVDGGWLNVTT